MTDIQPIERFLAGLFRRDIRLWAEDGRLRCSGPDAALTPELAAELRVRKADILAFLRTSHGAAAGEAAGTIPARHDPAAPLSFAQQRLWFLERMLGRTALHHMPFALEARGSLDEDALEMALQRVVARHAVLRTRIHDERGEPRQMVVEAPEINVARLDRRADPLGEGELCALIAEEAALPFDLAAEPPLRLTLLRIADDRTLLLFTLHHIAADGWSIDVLAGDLAAYYAEAVGGRPATLPALTIQYGDFSAWQRERLAGPELERLTGFWRRELDNPPVTRLPTDFVRPPVQNHAGALHRFAVPAPTTAALRQIAQSRGATLFATLFTTFNVLIYRYTGQSDMLVGTPVANRAHAETEPLIGLFVNPLPIRSQLIPHEGFATNLSAVQAGLWRAFEHQDLPFERLVEDLQPERDPSVHPLFQLKFQLDRAPREKIALPGVTLQRMPQQGGLARLDLSLDMLETEGGIAASFEYATALFRPETIAALAGHFVTLLEAIAADPAMPIASLAMLPEPERRQLAVWNETARDFNPAVPFHKMFEARAALAPNAIALIHDTGDGEEHRETYAALNARANQLAHHLRALGVGPEVIVGIALERSPYMVAAWLAVLKAGGAYLPLDPAYPPERLAYMLDYARAALVISHSGIALPPGTRRLDLDTEWPAAAPTDNPTSVTRPDHLAYVIYTSGSTGRPKGVLIEHGGLVNLTEDKIRVCDVRPGDCVLQFFSFSFDASIPELVMSLAAGASLLLASPADLLPAPGLARLLERHRVSHVTMTPSALLSLPAGDFPDLRIVLVGGEAPTAELIARWCPTRVFINAYGPTETTVNASMVPCGNGAPLDATLWPAANKQLHVLDDNLEPLPGGVPGELYIGGVGLARGYHGRPDLTAERFLPDPFAQGPAGVLYRTGDRASRLRDGRIRILGRVDHQVKIRGYRIELGEIEQALLGHPDVASALVVVRESEGGDKRLVAYAVAQGAERASPQAVRGHLRERLPRFLVPDAFVWLDALPLTVNRKVDTAALPAPEQASRRDGRAPLGETEIALAAMFGELLGAAQVSAEEDFFELGGHSLMATRLVAMALGRFGIELSVLDLFTGPTVAALAARIEARRQGASAREAVPAGNDAWRADVVLAGDIRPAATVTAPGPFRRVLLTGATGFLGAYLTRELLREPDTEVWCLVRGADGIARIRQAMHSYGLRHDTLLPRLRVLSGDLAAPGLGLDPATYAQLTANIDAIIHNGAEVNHLQPYDRLRVPNVEGTREILRLACAGRGRPLHYISSLSVLPVSPLPGRPRFYEDDDLADYPAPLGGYNRSKWVAEQLVAEAGRRGLPVTIYRPGPVSGDSRTGAFNAADFLCRLMQGYIHSGTAPHGAVHLDMMPVDYLARALIYLGKRAGSIGQTYHLIHSRPVSSDLLFEACLAEGFPIRRVAYREWRRALMDIARDDPAHPLYPLVALFATREEDEDAARTIAELPFDTRNSLAALADAPFPEPDLDLSLFRTYLRAFARAGAIPGSPTTGGMPA